MTIRERTRAALWAAITTDAPLSRDAAAMWALVLDTAVCERRQGAVGRVIRGMGWLPTTATSRLARSGLPSLTKCSSWTGFVFAAALFDGGDDRIASVGYTLGHASAGSFGRFTRNLVGLTPGYIRGAVPFPMAREMMLDQVIRPYRDQWATFAYRPAMSAQFVARRALAAA